LFLYCCSPRSYMPGTFGAGTLREYNVSHETLKGVQVYLGVNPLVQGFGNRDLVYIATTTSTSYNNTTSQGIGYLSKDGQIKKSEIHIPINTPGVIVKYDLGSLDVDFGDKVVLSFIEKSDSYELITKTLYINGVDYQVRGTEQGYYLISQMNFQDKGVETTKEINVVKGKTIK